MASRKEKATTTIEVRHVAKPFGKNRENPPSLKDLREFVEACEGLPDDTVVYVSKGQLDEGGRYNYEFSVHHTVREETK